MPIPPRKKKPDLALLMEEPEPSDPALDEEPDDDEDDALLDEDMPEEDPLAALDEGGDEAFDIPPDQAALAETLGFTEPDQQQALIDLIKLVTSPDPMATESSMPPLPESTY